MRTLRALLTCTLLAVAGFGFLQQSSRVEVTYKEYLGFSLMPGANSSAVTFHIIRKWDDPAKPLEARNISQAEFMRVASGMIKCDANPKQQNLFAENGLTDCGWFNDTVINHILYESGTRCNTMNDIWRLRYGEWPYHIQAPRMSNNGGNSGPNTLNPVGPGPGWARKPLQPSEGQLEILKAYGPEDPMVDVIWGVDAFRLLKDMQNTDWVNTYKGS